MKLRAKESILPMVPTTPGIGKVRPSSLLGRDSIGPTVMERGDVLGSGGLGGGSRATVDALRHLGDDVVEDVFPGQLSLHREVLGQRLLQGVSHCRPHVLQPQPTVKTRLKD